MSAIFDFKECSFGPGSCISVCFRPSFAAASACNVEFCYV